MRLVAAMVIIGSVAAVCAGCSIAGGGSVSRQGYSGSAIVSADGRVLTAGPYALSCPATVTVLARESTGLAAQVAARGNRGTAEHLLSLARGIYAMAQTTNVKSIVTTYPHDFYPGSEWKRDMLWDADEIALADEALHAPRTQVRATLR
jgi:hypothetical protein